MNPIDNGNLQLGITDSWTPNNIIQQQQHISLYDSKSIFEYGRIFVLNNVLQFEGDYINSSKSLLNLVKPLIEDYITRKDVVESNTIQLLNRVAGEAQQSLKFMHHYYKGLYKYSALTNTWGQIPREVLASNWTLPQGNGFIDIMFNTAYTDGQLFYLSAPNAAYKIGLYTFNAGPNTWTLDTTINFGNTFENSPSDGQLFYLVTDFDTVQGSLYLDASSTLVSDIALSASSTNLFALVQPLINGYIKNQTNLHIQTQDYNDYTSSIPSLM